MEIDINIPAHDLLWRRMSLITKRAYRESYGAARDTLVGNEVRDLIASGYAVLSGAGFELTPTGKELYTKMTTVCKKSE
ncbi:MAG: hypothetical protein ACXV6L_06940 [Halobacteriota archaeon]